MSKGSFFTGQPIFNQILNFISKGAVLGIARDLKADYYSKSFRTYEHLVTMLYAIFNQCNSLREVTTGLLAWDKRIHHLGMDFHPRRSTISDANNRRSHEVFERIYFKLLKRYQPFLPDSRTGSRKDNLYIFDSTTITLFQEILKGSGLSKIDGKRKGGIKVHTLLKARQDTPTMVRYSAGADSDVKYLKTVQLPTGSFIVFDRGYRDYSTYNRFTQQNITWITRHKDNSVYKIKERRVVNDHQKNQGIIKDWIIELGHDHTKNAVKVTARLIRYKDPITKKQFLFLTNNLTLAPLTISAYYKQRWQIETFFKRIKQNYPLQYFLGDNENAIKIQIWCALIADLLLRMVKKGTQSKMAFSNIVSLVRLHLMTYMSLKDFLHAPEKSLIDRTMQNKRIDHPPSLFPT